MEHNQDTIVYPNLHYRICSKSSDKKRKETATLLLLRIYLNPRYAISF